MPRRVDTAQPLDSYRSINAAAESTIGLYKAECIATDVFHAGPWHDFADVEYATYGWVNWYNHSRLHTATGLVPPAEYETTYYQTTITENTPV